MDKIELVPDQTKPNRMTVVRHSISESPDLERTQPTTFTVVQGTHTDRARAFNIQTLGISTVVAVCAGIGAVVLASVPLLSFTFLMVLASGYLITWTIAYILHHVFSAEGIQLFESVMFWRYIDREQKHSYDRMDPNKWIERK